MTPDEHRIIVDAIHDSATVIHKGQRMNQRIRELAEQAGLKYYNWSTNESNIIDGEFKYPRLEDYAKFAKLIVAECINKIESQRSSGENTDQWTITRDLCYHNMMSGLKQHFGVE